MRVESVASFAIIIGGVFWGLFWLPIRALGEAGLQGAWPGALVYSATALYLLPLVILRRRRFTALWRPLAVCGLFTGIGFSFYATSLLLTDVVRVILLFYLTPVWGTLLGLAILGERLTINRIVALLLGIAGLLVVLGAGTQFPWPQNIGDWLALGSGLSWAYASLRLYQMGSVAVPEQVSAFVAGGLVVSLVVAAIGGSVLGGMPSLHAFQLSTPIALATGLYMLPMLVLTIWPATILTPGRVGLLFMSEVVVGVASAALLTGEPFGLREMVGTALIVSAAIAEILGRRSATVEAGGVVTSK